MKFSTRMSDSVHILVFIHLSELPTLSSGDIAASIHTNPSYVRQLMAGLKGAGLLNSSRGMATPTLGRPPDQITLLDIYQAVEGDKPLLHLDTHTNPACSVGVNIQLALQEYYDRIQHTAEGEMGSITLQDVIDTYERRIHP